MIITALFYFYIFVYCYYKVLIMARRVKQKHRICQVLAIGLQERLILMLNVFRGSTKLKKMLKNDT